MVSALRKLEVVLHTELSKHYSVKALMVLKAGDKVHTQSLNIHVSGTEQITDWSCDTKLILHWHWFKSAQIG